jgi:hypothetical protein
MNYDCKPSNTHVTLQKVKPVLAQINLKGPFNATSIIILLSLFLQNKSRLMRSPCHLCLWIPPTNFWMLQPIMKLGYVHHGTWAHLSGVLHKSLPSVSVCICIPIVARQRLDKNVMAEMKTHKRRIVSMFSMESVSYQRKVGDQLFPELLVFLSCQEMSAVNQINSSTCFQWSYVDSVVGRCEIWRIRCRHNIKKKGFQHATLNSYTEYAKQFVCLIPMSCSGYWDENLCK